MNIISIIICILCLIMCCIIGYCFGSIIKFTKQLETDRKTFIKISDLLRDIIKQNSEVISHTGKAINVARDIDKQNTNLINILEKDLEYIKNKLN